MFLDDDGILGDEDLGKPSKSKASVVVSVANGLTPVVGLFAGKLCDRWGPRPVLTMGGITLGLGLTAASYCKDFVMFTLSFGLILGISGGCTISPGIAAVGGWFDLRRPLAFGVAYAGSGLGTTLCPILASYLLEHNSWRNSFRYLACMSQFAFFFRQIMARHVLWWQVSVVVYQGESFLCGFIFLLHFPLLLAVNISIIPFFHSYGHPRSDRWADCRQTHPICPALPADNKPPLVEADCDKQDHHCTVPCGNVLCIWVLLRCGVHVHVCAGLWE